MWTDHLFSPKAKPTMTKRHSRSKSKPAKKSSWPETRLVWVRSVRHTCTANTLGNFELTHDFEDVLFQISRVGNDGGAISFLKDLSDDTDLKPILHCTSCRSHSVVTDNSCSNIQPDQNVDINYENDDPIFTYAPVRHSIPPLRSRIRSH